MDDNLEDLNVNVGDVIKITSAKHDNLFTDQEYMIREIVENLIPGHGRAALFKHMTLNRDIVGYALLRYTTGRVVNRARGKKHTKRRHTKRRHTKRRHIKRRR